MLCVRWAGGDMGVLGVGGRRACGVQRGARQEIVSHNPCFLPWIEQQSFCMACKGSGVRLRPRGDKPDSHSVAFEESSTNRSLCADTADRCRRIRPSTTVAHSSKRAWNPSPHRGEVARRRRVDEGAVRSHRAFPGISAPAETRRPPHPALRATFSPPGRRAPGPLARMRDCSTRARGRCAVL